MKDPSLNGYMSLKSHEELIAWQKGFILTKRIYELTALFPVAEQFGLSSQMRRAAVSVPSNIAEGYNRASRKEYRQCCFVAFGSINELQTQLKIAKELGYAARADYGGVESLLNDAMRVLHGLCRSL